MSISAPARYPSGKRKPGPEPRHPGHHTLWRRHRDNWDEMVRAGSNPMWGTVIGKLYISGVLTEIEARAARLYAEVTGQFDRDHGITRRSIPSPAYQSGLYGRDDEVGRHEKNGTLEEYERRAIRSKREWERMQSCLITPAMREAAEEVCIFDREITYQQVENLKMALGNIARKFGVSDMKNLRKQRKGKENGSGNEGSE